MPNNDSLSVMLRPIQDISTPCDNDDSAVPITNDSHHALRKHVHRKFALHVNNPAETPSHNKFRTPITPLTAAEPRASPLSRVANSSARRRREKVVLQSPARRGHSVCIRQIFSDQQQQQQQQQQRRVVYKGYDKVYGDLFYPPLPNVSRQLQPRSKPHVSTTVTLKSDRPSLYNRTLSLCDNALPASITEAMDREQMTDHWSEDENEKSKKEVQEGFCYPDLNVVGAASLSHAATEDDCQNVCLFDTHQSTRG
jgi:hypothetical protein